VAPVTPLGLGTVANQLLSDTRFRRVAVITTATTGNPALGTIDFTLADSALILQYAGEGQPGGFQLKDVGEEVTRPHLDGAFDLAMIDPFHTYGSSLECLEMAFGMLRPGGVLLVHDCLPPPEYTKPSFVPGNWCGTTFAAFRDLCVANGLGWFTLGTDFGIGVAVKPQVPVEPRGPDDAWTEHTHDEYVRRYSADPCAFMQAVDAADADAALDLTLGDEAVLHLLMPFPGWPDLRERLQESSDRSRQRLLEDTRGLRDELDSLAEHIRVLRNDLDATNVQNLDLRQQVALLQAHVVETGRPTWQAQALLKSTPRAVRARLAPRVRRLKR
jgi:SAM-dependent methyltransferase